MRKKTNPLLSALLMLLGSVPASPFVASVSAQNHDEKPLELSGFSLSQAYEIADGNPLDLSDPNLNKLLYRIKKTATENLRKASRYSQEINWRQLNAETADFRLWVFHRRGRVRRISPLRLPGTGRDDPIRGVYLANCQTESGERFDVLTLTSPAAWKSGESLDQPVEFVGFLYGLIDENQSADTEDFQNGGNVPLFVAKRLAWFPEKADPVQRVTDSHVLLAAEGVDIGQLDFVRQQYSKPLGNEDSEVFFQMLSAIGSISNVKDSLQPLGFTELMEAPLDNFGNAVSFQARVRKCSPIQITNPDLHARLGFDHYYQLMVFPDLDGQQIVVNNPGGEDLVYGRFPVTMCARSLPAGMQPADIEDQQIIVNGFYFRFWKYASELTDQAGSSGQISPLIISSRPVLVVSDEATLNLILGGFLFATILGLAAMFWLFRSSKKRAALQSLPNRLPDQLDVTGIE